MIRTILFASLLGSCTATLAETLFITCKTATQPNWNTGKLYSKRPAPSLDGFVEDMILRGQAGVLMGPPKSWKLDTATRTLTTPEQRTPLVFTDVVVTDSAIRASLRLTTDTTRTLDLNRITGTLSFRVSFDEKFVTDWKRENGGSFPVSAEWTLSCTSSSKPKV